ncbi:MAG: EscU/YscU/HrcU family type III secretion system export apparatus switch protein [Mariprofundales bacterium]|nr:EscU/YscU/HrcU family type III secretion system export apparatus switch protein [Mariprofundales bacterium]
MADSRIGCGGVAVARDQPAAVGYDSEGGGAPKVLASGFGEVANRIMDLARESGVHIHRDDNLVQLLAQVPVGHEIPEAAYQLVADLLSFLYRTDQRLAEKKRTASR